MPHAVHEIVVDAVAGVLDQVSGGEHVGGRGARAQGGGHSVKGRLGDLVEAPVLGRGLRADGVGPQGLARVAPVLRGDLGD